MIGNVSSGRTHPVDGIEEALGLFIETLPVHYSLSSDACLADWLAAHQVAQSGHGMHGHIGLGAIQGLVGLSGQALFDAVFVYENYPVDIDDDVTMGGLSFTGADGYDDTHYPIGLVVAPSSEGMSLRFSYQLGYMDDAVAGVLVEQLTALLGRLGGVGGVPLGGINTIIPEQEAAALLHAAGPVVEHDASLLTLPCLFDAQSGKTPDAVALILSLIHI